MKIGEYFLCNRCKRKIKAKECKVRLIKKTKITHRGYCQKGWVVRCNSRECYVEKKYLRCFTIHEWLEL